MISLITALVPYRPNIFWYGIYFSNARATYVQSYFIAIR